MFENSSLQELYTGSLIAGKGKLLNNIRVIMERSKFRSEDWARVRFGAGTPWRRCWCVIDPPNEKEFQKEQKSLKKRSAYDRPTILKGDIKFYDTKKTKKATPIATITDAYSAYAIYPQSKPLIDQSTLVKVEGRITIHLKPESQTEGFVFVMPEVHPAVSGFEMMLRWLFPVYDTFGLYGRPMRLIADTLDSRGLMFAMPKERRYGYLDIQDVAGLVCKEGNQTWSEQDWRKQMKDVTSKRLSSTTSRTASRQGSWKGVRTSLPAGANLRYEDGASIRSTPSQRHKHNESTDTVFLTPQKTRTAGPGGSLTSANYHARSASDTLAFSNSPRRRQEQYVPSRLSIDQEPEALDRPPLPPVHGRSARKGRPGDLESSMPRMSLDNEGRAPVRQEPDEVGSELRPQPPPTPVAAPPAFLHSAGERPSMRPNASPELRRANSRMSVTTLSQLVDASKSGTTSSDAVAAAGAAAAWKNNEGLRSQEQAFKGVNETTNRQESPADERVPSEGLVAGLNNDEILSASQPHNHTPGYFAERPHELIRSSTEKSVVRKPVRADKSMASSPLSTPGKESVEGYIKTKINDIPVSAPESKQTIKPQQIRHTNPHHNFGTSVDYAGMPTSSNGERLDLPVHQQRRKALRTVGYPNNVENTSSRLQPDVSGAHAATTQNYWPGVGNGSGAPAAQIDSPRWDHSRTPSDSLTPKDERRLSYLGGVSPNGDSNSCPHSHSPNSGDRAVPWQPGAAAGSGQKSPGPRMSPEEFVQQRATANRVVSPVYAHQRNRSTGHLPPQRTISGDWSKRKELSSRPSSGDVSAILAQQQDYSTYLSAREQEHVARMTNSPLVNMTTRKQQSSQGSSGLVGAIEAREQEKKQVREGISGQMVQHAIAQRQQQAANQMAQQQKVYHQAQHQTLSSQAQAYQTQGAAGFFMQPQPQSRSTPNSPEGWGMQSDPQQWPNGQTQAYRGGVPPQQQHQRDGGGQQHKPEWQARLRKPAPGQK